MRDAALGRTRAFTGGFVTQRRTRRILKLAGYPISFGWPKPHDSIAIGAMPQLRNVDCKWQRRRVQNHSL